MNFAYEHKLWSKGYKYLAGVDEAGRGPLAGPIVAAAVIFSIERSSIKGLADSKLLSCKKRKKLFPEIKRKALAFGIGIVSHKLIDKLGIGEANLLAMIKAINALTLRPDYLLVDGARNKLGLDIAQKSIIGGDSKCASIAAASIIATRDRMMLRYHKKYSQYNFAQHKGYGTRKHMQKIYQLGPCPIHRRSFFPVSHLIKA